MSKPIAKLITLQAITFLHPGTGQTSGVVDLPIQREVHTEFPMIAASGLKGSLRDKAEQQGQADGAKTISCFGATTENSDTAPSAGSLALTDARLLAFPVRSLQQVFVWVTCPQVLKRLARDAQLVGLAADQLPQLKLTELAPKAESALVTKNSTLTTPLVLEEIAYPCESNEALDTIATTIASLLTAESGFDPKRLVLISDEDFKYHVKYSTQISARIKLNELKTTTGGGGNLWYEETLPPETLFYAFALCHPPRKAVDDFAAAQDVADYLHQLSADGYLQIGANETLGQGWCGLKISPALESVS